MQPGRLYAIIVLIAPLTLPTSVHAQGSSGVQLFSAYDNSFPGGAGTGGVGLTLGAGPVALRGSWGVTLATLAPSMNGTSPANAGRWSGDVDLLLADNFLGLGSLFGGIVHPYGFAGIGLHSASISPAFNAAVKTWSYGGGVALPLSPSISLDGEMRNRTRLATSLSSSSDFISGTEWRGGLAYRVGSGRPGSPMSSSRGGAGGGACGPGRASPLLDAPRPARRRVLHRARSLCLSVLHV